MTDTKAPETGLARRAPDALAQFRGEHTDAMKATVLLELAAKQYHLVSPATTTASIPDGCAIATAMVLVNPTEDTYPIPGGSKRGLSKPTLDKISHAAGVTAVPEKCGRLDDGSHPYYVHYRWVGRVRHFDGQFVEIVGEKELDLRPGSATVKNLTRIAQKKGRADALSEIEQMRSFILAHAETKARLRAIRSLGVKTSYSEEELAKPFVVAKFTLTGKFSDPAARAQYTEKLTDSFLGSSQAMYGGAPRTPPAALPMATRRAGPPPVGAVPADDDDPAPEEPPPEQPAAPVTVRHAEGSDQVRMPGKKGGTVADAEYDDLVFWRGKIAQGLKDDPNGKYAANNRKQLAMIEAELAARDAPDDEPKTADATVTDAKTQGTSNSAGSPGSAEGGVSSGNAEGSVPAERPASSRPATSATMTIPTGRSFPEEGKTLEQASDDTLKTVFDRLDAWLNSDGAKSAPEDVLARVKKMHGAVLDEAIWREARDKAAASAPA
jgi:hypothetical protein